MTNLCLMKHPQLGNAYFDDLTAARLETEGWERWPRSKHRKAGGGGPGVPTRVLGGGGPGVPTLTGGGGPGVPTRAAAGPDDDMAPQFKKSGKAM